METERAGNKYKQVEYMQEFFGEEFEGVVSGVAHLVFGLKPSSINAKGLSVSTVFWSTMISAIWRATMRWLVAAAAEGSGWVTRCG